MEKEEKLDKLGSQRTKTTQTNIGNATNRGTTMTNASTSRSTSTNANNNSSSKTSSTTAKEGKPNPKKKKRKRSTGEKVLLSSFKWLFIFFCLGFAVIFGLVVGYSVLGEGNTADVFQISTWKHLFDLVFK